MTLLDIDASCQKIAKQDLLVLKTLVKIRFPEELFVQYFDGFTREHHNNYNTLLKENPDLSISEIISKYSGASLMACNMSAEYLSGLISSHHGRITPEQKVAYFLSYKKERLLELIKEKFQPKSKSAEPVLIDPKKPFTNVMEFKKTLSNCNEFLHWIDPYFSKKGLEIISEVLNENENQFKEIKILASATNINSEFRDNFKRLQKELTSKSVTIEIRILHGQLKKDIHDRWIISKNIQYKLPSIDNVYRGQLSEISESKVKLSFDDWWEDSLDLVKDWTKVESEIKTIGEIKNVSFKNSELDTNKLKSTSKPIDDNVVQKRVSAMDSLWKSTLDYNKYCGKYLFFFDIIKPSEYMGASEKTFKHLFYPNAESDFCKKLDLVNELELQRPYLGDDLWALFANLTTFEGRLVVNLIIEKKQGEIKDWRTDKYTISLLQKMLTDEEIKLNTNGILASASPIVKLIHTKIQKKISSSLF